MSGCSPELDCFWIDNPQLFINIAFLLSFATLLEIFFLVLYQRLTFKNAATPTCCQLALMDNVTNPHLIIVVSSIEQLSQNQSDSSQPVDPPDQSNISINVDPDNISRKWINHYALLHFAYSSCPLSRKFTWRSITFNFSRPRLATDTKLIANESCCSIARDCFSKSEL